MLNNLTLKFKIMLLSILMVLGLVVLGLSAFVQLKQFNSIVVESAEHIQRRSEILANVQQASIHFKTQVQEWKNILIRGNDPAQLDKYTKGFIKEEGEVNALLHKAMELQKLEAEPIDAYQALVKEHATLGENYRKALEKFDRADSEVAAQEIGQLAGEF